MAAALLLLAVLLAPPARAAALEELLEQAGVEAPAPVAPPAGAPVPRTRRFTVLSFNIKANPEAWVSGWDLRRLARIGDELARRRAAGDAPDVVLLQECFGPGTPPLRRHAGYPHRVQGPGAAHSVLDSGLWILSLHPVRERRALSFAPEGCRGADCFASKGALLVRLSVPGVPFPVDVLTTHAQSGPGEAREAQRLRQFQEIEGLLPSGAEGPAFVAGDFNTDLRRPASYARLASWPLSNAGAACRADAAGCVVPPGTDPEELQARTHDQQFFAPGGRSYRVRPVSAARSFTPLGSYSDHLAYEVVYEIDW